MLVLKLGGSVITDKEKPMTAREELVRELLGVLAEEGFEGVLIHGGGSFGHYAAENVPSLEEGVHVVRKAMHDLVGIVEEAAVDVGLKVYPVTPATVFHSLNVIIEVLDRGCVPLLYGDVVPDPEGGFRIASGDELAEVVSALRPDRVGFGMAVPGVYEGKPGEGEPLEELTPEGARELAEELSGAAGVDVTGGISEKLRRAAAIAERGIEVVLFDATDPENVRSFVRGETVGTRIVPRQ
ncbi:MAG: isopentenyl phosphate kinase family protein [Methanopyri archaeon]|nr:isopentenyl phosphate kinase family protein [Methanopyri archaeon]